MIGIIPCFSSVSNGIGNPNSPDIFAITCIGKVYPNPNQKLAIPIIQSLKSQSSGVSLNTIICAKNDNGLITAALTGFCALNPGTNCPNVIPIVSIHQSTNILFATFGSIVSPAL